MKLKYFIGGLDIKLHPQLQRFFVDAILDEVYQPIFPTVLPKFRVLLGFEDVQKTIKFEARINSPKDELMQKMNFEVKPVLDKKVINHVMILDKMPLKDRGDYTLDLLTENEDGELKFFCTCSLLHANYPIRRVFRDGEIDAILEMEDLIKSIKVDYELPDGSKKYKFELSLDPDKKVEAGYEKFPEDNKVIFNDVEYDLTGIRRQVEWAFGQKIDKQKLAEEMKKRENNKKQDKK